MKYLLIPIAYVLSVCAALYLGLTNDASAGGHHYYRSDDCRHWGPMEEIVMGSEATLGHGHAVIKFMGQRCEDE
jgi:hypothetical protein